MNSQKGFVPIILLVIIFVVTGTVGGAYYYSRSKQISKTPSPETVKVTPTEATPPSTTPKSIEDWETDSATESPVETPTSTTTQSITVDDRWGHVTMDPTIAAFYMLIHNKGTEDDRLIGATSKVCSRIGLQLPVSGPPGSGEVPLNIIIPANSTVESKFGGSRVLCYGVSGVALGDHVPLTLVFERYGEVTTTIEIREANPSGDWPEPNPPSSPPQP